MKSSSREPLGNRAEKMICKPLTRIGDLKQVLP
jgi:hypothetical protein